jgi:hypothetical protein
LGIIPSAPLGPATTLDRVPKRIVPTHFNKDGRPKRGYVSEEVARAEAARLGMAYYRCDFCDRFHLASK